MALVRVVGALEPVRDPADAAFGQRELDRGELAQHRRPEQLGAEHAGVERHGVDEHVERRARHEVGRAAEVEHHDGVGVFARLPRRVPLVTVVVGHAEAVHLGVERDRVAALLGDAADLAGHPLGTEHEARQRERDEATGLRARPLFDVPVVVRADHARGELGVAALQEVLTTETGPRREAHRPEHTVDVHVAHALVHVVRADPDLAEVAGVHAPLGADATGHRVEAEARHLVTLHQPDIRAVVLGDHRRHVFAVLRREVVHEEVAHGRRFYEVVVDTDEDHVFELHVLPRDAWSVCISRFIVPVSDLSSPDRPFADRQRFMGRDFLAQRSSRAP